MSKVFLTVFTLLALATIGSCIFLPFKLTIHKGLDLDLHGHHGHHGHGLVIVKSIPIVKHVIKVPYKVPVYYKVPYFVSKPKYEAPAYEPSYGADSSYQPNPYEG